MTDPTRALPQTDPVLDRSMKLPPVGPLAVAAGVMLTADAVVDIIGWVPPLGPWLLGQAGLLAVAWIAGKYFRDRAQGLSTGRAFARWEDPAGTGRAVPLLYAASVVVLLAHTRDLRWWPLVLGLLAVAGVAHSIARRRPSAEPRFVVTDQTPPEPLADYKQVTLPWDLAPGLPDVKGAIATWIRRAKVAQYRPPTNPGTNWEVAVDGTARPAFEWYIDHGQCDEIDNLADQISAVSVTHGLSAYTEVDVTLDLVQTIDYRRDDDPAVPEETRFEDYWRFPLETVFDEAGDCDDSSILAVALLSALGHRTCFFGRRLPDVAGDADPYTGMIFRAGGGSLLAGGTSASAPLWAGIGALAQQAIRADRKGAQLGPFQPILAKVAADHPQAFRDLAIGGIATARAGRGRDDVAGWGTPDVPALISAVRAEVPSR